MVLIFFILSCTINGIYYFWFVFIAFLSKKGNNYDSNDSDENDFHFFLVIPCLNEAKVIYETVTNLLLLKMPNTKVIAINDGSNDNTLKILNNINNDNLIIINRIYPDARKGKGMALNEGYQMVKTILRESNSKLTSVCEDIKEITEENDIDHSKVIIGILDADTFINRSLLEHITTIMQGNSDVGLVQARVRIGTTTRNNLLTIMQDIEFFTIINKMQNLREYTGTVAAAGNGQFNRLSAMETLGELPWSNCLLEDFDFSLRLLLNGWKTRLIQDEIVYQQGVISYRKFIKQRARWSQGCIQCFSYIRNVIKSQYLSIYSKIEIISFLFLPWFTLLSSMTLFFSIFLIIYMYLSKSSALILKLSSYTSNNLLALLIIILVLVFVPGLVFSILYKKDTKDRIFKVLLIGLLLPIYCILQIPSVITAFCREILSINSWMKTDRN